MNYLAHLHIAQHCNSNLAGNLLGDFVKGDPNKQFASDLSDGIKLHRYVDRFTDSHPVAKHCKSLFPDETRRFSPIALDVFWDHFLAKHWKQFHESELAEFCVRTHQEIDKQMEPHWPDNFKFVHDKMWQGRWLESYQHLGSIELVLSRMSQRRPRLAPLESCYPVLEQKYELLQRHFFELYPDILDSARQFNRQNSA
ncbi:ACP phosphodiesterase [Vibrio profundi]|uniref:acyl carrier protein phosphodiesterase n=1 Tax=Vibrio profundi TaxID=1774960 RepID=UPI0037362954